MNDTRTTSEAGGTDIVDIASMGAGGEALGTPSEVRPGARGGRLIAVPFALPGEQVLVRRRDERAHLVEVMRRSPERQAAVCRHFGSCGGCALQHWQDAPYRAWKSGLVADALAARGLAAPMRPLWRAQAGQRRRAVLSARRGATATFLGFFEAGTHNLVDIAECPVLEPRIVAALPGLRDLLAPLVSRRGTVRVTIAHLDNGLDVAVAGETAGVDVVQDADLRARLARDAAALRLLRLSVAAEPLYRSATPVVSVAGVAVTPPPGAFLQASRQAEGAMTDILMASLGKRVQRVADLFCGLGTFTLAMAARAQVLGVDSDKELAAALAGAARGAQRLKPIETWVRDLMREPLSPLELNGFDAVIFDPPRAGAEAQAARLARSTVRMVVAVSCNPVTLARDMRILVDGGFAIESVTPVDQFPYTPHVESVAVLRRTG